MAVMGQNHDLASDLHYLLQLIGIDQPNGWRFVSLIAILSHLMVWSCWRSDEHDHACSPCRPRASW
jgi:hypothetical protein